MMIRQCGQNCKQDARTNNSSIFLLSDSDEESTSQIKSENLIISVLSNSDEESKSQTNNLMNLTLTVITM